MNKTLRQILRYLIAQNCFYLISGFLMLLGCLLMSKAPGADDVQLSSGLKLLCAVVAYQAIVVALAVRVRQLGVVHDAFNLTLVALALLLDPTFFSTRFWGHSLSAGLWINGATFAVSVVMFLVLARIGQFPIDAASARAWIFALLIVYMGAAGLAPELGWGKLVFAALCFVPLAHAALARDWSIAGEPAGEASGASSGNPAAPESAAAAGTPDSEAPREATPPSGAAGNAETQDAKTTAGGAGAAPPTDSAGAAGREGASKAAHAGGGTATTGGSTASSAGQASSATAEAPAGGTAGVTPGASAGATPKGVWAHAKAPSPASGQAEHPVLWGDPRSIYHGYLKALLMFYPFLVSFRHLFGLGASFNFDYGFAQLAPGILGLAILLGKAVPEFLSEAPWVLHALGLLSMYAASGMESVRFAPGTGHGVVWLSPLAAMCAANAVFGIWIWKRRAQHVFPLYATACSVGLAMCLETASPTGSPLILQPLALGCLALWLVAWARLDRGFWEIYRALAVCLLWILQMSTLSSQIETGILSQALPALYLVLVHAYPRKDLKGTCLPVAASALMLMLAATHSATSHANLIAAGLYGEIALLLVASRLTQGVAYGPLAIGAALVEASFRLAPMAGELDIGSLVERHAGPAALVLAFVTLYIGYRVTLKKEEIIRWIDDEPGPGNKPHD